MLNPDLLTSHVHQRQILKEVLMLTGEAFSQYAYTGNNNNNNDNNNW